MSVGKDVNGNFSIPEWVNEEFFIDILKDNFQGFTGIQSFRVEPGISAGENYMSIILRVFIGVKLQGKNLLLILLIFFLFTIFITQFFCY